MINVELTHEDAELFRFFMAHHNQIALMFDAGVFNVRHGKAIINFDGAGTITEIKFDITGYKRGFPVIAILAPIQIENTQELAK